MPTGDVEVMVTGGTGFIGRWLLAELTKRQNVAALVRGAAARGPELAAFVAARGGDPGRLLVVEGDVEAASLGLAGDFGGVRDVYHLAARFAFGLPPDEARRCHAGGSLAAAEWALARPRLRRFVYLGGYRLTRAARPGVGPLDGRARARLYREHGGYEASKFEAYWAVRDFAAARGLPWTAGGASRRGRSQPPHAPRAPRCARDSPASSTSSRRACRSCTASATPSSWRSGTRRAPSRAPATTCTSATRAPSGRPSATFCARGRPGPRAGRARRRRPDAARRPARALQGAGVSASMRARISAARSRPPWVLKA